MTDYEAFSFFFICMKSYIRKYSSTIILVIIIKDFYKLIKSKQVPTTFLSLVL